MEILPGKEMGGVKAAGRKMPGTNENSIRTSCKTS
jgi:hypothetical protein